MTPTFEESGPADLQKVAHFFVRLFPDVLLCFSMYFPENELWGLDWTWI
jgi:hypothetical protein